MNLKEILDETFKLMKKHRLVSTQYDFSKNWLKRSKGYFAYIKSTGAEPTADVMLELWTECKKRSNQWEKIVQRQTDDEPIYKILMQLTMSSNEIERFVGHQVQKVYLAK